MPVLKKAIFRKQKKGNKKAVSVDTAFSFIAKSTKFWLI